MYGILDLLIKNKLIFVHGRVLACFLDTLLRLKREIHAYELKINCG